MLKVFQSAGWTQLRGKPDLGPSSGCHARSGDAVPLTPFAFPVWTGDRVLFF